MSLSISFSYFPRYLLYSTSEIKGLFISSTETKVYSLLLPSASSLVRNQANISLRLLADSVSNVKLCVGGGIKYCLSSTHVSNLASLCDTKSFVTLRYKKFFHSVIQKFQNLVSLCDTKHFKQSFKVSSLNFTQALHHSIHLAIQNFQPRVTQ